MRDGMVTPCRTTISLEEQTVRYCISLARGGEGAGTERRFCRRYRQRPPHPPQNVGPERVPSPPSAPPITFGVGPAGTGKTYLAVAMAVKAFKSKDVSRIILTRPAVEAGEAGLSARRFAK